MPLSSFGRTLVYMPPSAKSAPLHGSSVVRMPRAKNVAPIERSEQVLLTPDSLKHLFHGVLGPRGPEKV